MKDIEKRNCSLWICSNNTEEECLSFLIFGATENAQYFYKDLKKGDVCFLYNMTSRELIGPFIAISNPQHDINPHLWKGRFPFQIQVKPYGETFNRIKNGDQLLYSAGVRLRKTDQGNLIPSIRYYDAEITKKLVKPFHTKESETSTHEGIPTEKQGNLLGFDAVAGLEEIKNFIRERMLEPFLNPWLAEIYQLKRGGGLLLWGPPGTGKTLLARATAEEIGAYFLEISPSVVHGFPGEPEKNLERLFQEALNRPRSVIFFDEAESLLRRRQDASGSTVMQRIIPRLLSLFSKVRTWNAPVLIFGATNKPNDIDKAFLRPGRFDYIKYVGIPDEAARVQILKIKLKGRPISPELKDEQCLFEISRKLEGWTGADIENLLDRVALRVFQRVYRENYKDRYLEDLECIQPIRMEDIENVLQSGEIKPSLSEDIIKQYEELKVRFLY